MNKFMIGDTVTILATVRHVDNDQIAIDFPSYFGDDVSLQFIKAENATLERPIIEPGMKVWFSRRLWKVLAVNEDDMLWLKATEGAAYTTTGILTVHRRDDEDMTGIPFEEPPEPPCGGKTGSEEN